MAQQTIGIGTVANDGTGDPLRTAFDKVNDNFDEVYRNAGIVWQEDFTGASYDTAVIKTFNGGTISHDTANDRLSVTSTASGSKGIYLDNNALGLVDGEWYAIEIDWARNTCHGINVASAWVDSSKPRKSFVDDGFPATFFHLQSSGGDGSFYSPLIMPGFASGASAIAYINSIKIYKANADQVAQKRDGLVTIGNNSYSAGTYDDIVLIGNNNKTLSGANQVIIGQACTGNGADAVAIGTSQANTHSVAIGKNALATNATGGIAIGENASVVDTGGDDCIAIGAGASVDYDSTHADTVNSPLRLAVGDHAKATSWRATAIGSYAMAFCTSATALGTGAVSETTHGMALGRGSYIPEECGASGACVMEVDDFYLSNGPYSHCDAAPSGISILEVSGVDPTTYTSRFIGKCALDARATPSDTNIGGGNIAMCAGAGIGTGEGGSVLLQTAPAGTTGSSQNAWVTAIEVDAAATGGSDDTRFLLLDLTDGSLKRVSFGADDSGGSGFKVLRVAN